MIKKKQDITLTSDQQKAVQECEAYITGTKYTDKEWVTIEGRAGTGKSLSTKYLIEKFPNKAILGLAISHQAVNRLRDGLEEQCETFAKGLNKKNIKNYKTGESKFITINKIDDYPMIKDYDIIIADECSQYSDTNIKELLFFKKEGAKIIMLGDPAQNPAIVDKGEIFREKSKSFDNTIARLSQVMRSNEPITGFNAVYSDRILDYFDNGTPINPHIPFEDDIRGLHNVSNKEGLINHFLNKFDPKDLNSAKILAFRRDTVDYYNRVIRSRLLGNVNSQILKGDVLQAESSYNQGRIKNKMMLTIKDIQAANIQGFASFVVTLIDEYGAQHSDVRILDNKAEKAFRAKMWELSSKKKWKQFYQYKDLFFNYSYGFAGTSHSLQGSSIKSSLVDAADIFSVTKTNNLAKMQSYYVSISRAMESVLVYGAR